MSNFHNPLFWLSLLPTPIFIGYIVRRYVAALHTQPKITKEDIVYQERFASGASQKNILTKIGGARNCLRLVVTRDLLWVTSWFPFTVLAAAYDLVHVIPLRSIIAVRPERYFGTDTLLLSYTDGSGRSHSLRLAPKNAERFLRAIQPQSGFASPTNVAAS
jgi:hypothetical protein